MNIKKILFLSLCLSASSVSLISAACAASASGELNVQTSAMFMAMCNRNMAGVRAALEAGADVNAKSSTYGKILCTQAADNYTDHQYYELLELALEFKADINALDGGNTTALMKFVQRGKADAVVLLLKAGANPNIRNGLRATAFDFLGAGRMNSEEHEIFQLLKQHGGKTGRELDSEARDSFEAKKKLKLQKQHIKAQEETAMDIEQSDEMIAAKQAQGKKVVRFTLPTEQSIRCFYQDDESYRVSSKWLAKNK